MRPRQSLGRGYRHATIAHPRRGRAPEPGSPLFSRVSGKRRCDPIAVIPDQSSRHSYRIIEEKTRALAIVPQRIPGDEHLLPRRRCRTADCAAATVDAQCSVTRQSRKSSAAAGGAAALLLVVTFAGRLPQLAIFLAYAFVQIRSQFQWQVRDPDELEDIRQIAQPVRRAHS